MLNLPDSSAGNGLMILTMLRPRRPLSVIFNNYRLIKIQNSINLNMCRAQKITRSRHQKGLCKRISAVKSTLRMLFKLNSLKLMVKFINLRKWKNTFIVVHCADQPPVWFSSNSVFITEGWAWFWFLAIFADTCNASLNNHRQWNDND